MQNINNWRLWIWIKLNALLTLIKQQDGDNYSVVDNISLYVKDRNINIVLKTRRQWS